MGALTEEDARSIETVAHYTHDEDQAYCMLYGATGELANGGARPHERGRERIVRPHPSASRRAAGVEIFDTIPIEADYTVGDMKLWLKVHHNLKDTEYDLVGPKGRWKMGAGSEVLQDDQARRPPRA